MIEIESATFEVTFEEGNEQIAVSFSESDRFDVSFGEGVEKEYRGQYEVTPTEEEQVLPTNARVMTDNVTVDAIPSDYVGSEVPQRTSSDLTALGDTVTAPAGYYAEASSKAVAHGSAKAPEGTVEVNPALSLDGSGLITATVEKDMVLTPTVVPGYVSSGTSAVLTASGSATRQLSTQSGSTIAPTESEQTAVASGKYTTGDVKVGAIPSTYVGSSIPQNDSSDLTTNGDTVTVPSGYYASNASKAVSGGSATPASSVSATGATVSTGTNTLTLSKTVSNTPQVSAGYVSSGTAGNTAVSLTASVNTRSSSDLTASGATVTAPAGYYASSASKAVTTGTAGTPTASKGAVNNHAISVTPSVTNTTGYITGGTKTGSAVSVSASEVTSGTKSITANDTGIDVTNYAAVDVNVQSSPNLQTKTKSYTPTETAQSEAVTADAGYDGLDEVDISVGAISSTYVGTGITQRTSSDLYATGATVTAPSGYYASDATNTITSGSATPPEVVNTGASITAGTNTITLSKTMSLTPTVTPGYIESGTAANRNVVLTANCNVLGATTYNASTDERSIPANTYLTGAQTLKGYAVQSKTFTANGTYTPDAGFNGFYTVTVNVSGGGGASNIVQGTFTTGSTTGTAETFSINYTGSGYPIALMVYVDGGAYNNSTGGNTTWYNSVQRYAVGAFYMTKSRIPTTPTYATSGADNYGTVAVIYKNSTSQATTYSRTSSMTANTYTSSSTNANATNTTVVRFKGNGKTVSYYVASSSYGLLASTKYAYIAVYSS